MAERGSKDRLGLGDSNGPYGSALELPSVAAMLADLQGMNFLTRFVARNQRQVVRDLERQVKELAGTVDGFYALLGPRNWIFHDDLNPDRVAPLLRLGADEAERGLIAYYQERAALRFMVSRLGRFHELKSRMTLIELAESDYHEGRNYSTVQTLLSVMDGFVNDVEPDTRRGLHARDAEDMTAWDSVVGHHLGLRHAHATFTRTFHKTSTEDVHELYRNGIVHGMLVNYDNDIVASKAWNRLFAVADWAASRKKAKEPPEERPSLRESVQQYLSNKHQHRQIMESLDAWQSSAIKQGDEAFKADPVIVATHSFLDAWRANNYGRMAQLLSPLMAGESESKTAGDLREDYSDRPLEFYDLVGLDHVAPAVASVRARLQVAGDTHHVKLNWTRSAADGRAVAPIETGSWRLMHWSLESMRDDEATAERDGYPNP